MLYFASALAKAVSEKTWMRLQALVDLGLDDEPCDDDSRGYDLLECKNEVRLASEQGVAIDDELSGINYEFVRYYRAIKMAVVAVFIDDSLEGAELRFFELLFPDSPDIPRDTNHADDRAFVFIPLGQENDQVRACVIVPGYEDAHGTWGVDAPEEYLSRLLRAAQQHLASA